MSIFDTRDEARDACLAHEPLCKCAVVPDDDSPGNGHYYILGPNETYGSEWEVYGHGDTQLAAWESAFELCFA